MLVVQGEVDGKQAVAASKRVAQHNSSNKMDDAKLEEFGAQ